MLNGYEDLIVRNAFYIGQAYSASRVKNADKFYIDAEVESALEMLDTYLEEINGVEYIGGPEYHRIVRGVLAIAEYLSNTLFGDLSLSMRHDVLFCAYLVESGTIILERVVEE